MTRASGTDWALGIEARSRALITEGENAEVFYREAIDRLGRAGLRVELARAQLLYGEWLRRLRHRHDARDPLRSAYETFDSIGAEAFAARARTELRAIGGQARERAVDARDALTLQEALIARLAGRGVSNPEIAAQLFISRATVAYHLRKVFVKLGVTSRDQLGQVLPARRDRVVPAAPQRLAPRAPRQPPWGAGLSSWLSSWPVMTIKSGGCALKHTRPSVIIVSGIPGQPSRPFEQE